MLLALLLLFLHFDIYAADDTANRLQTISNTSPIASFISDFKNVDYNTAKNQEYGLQCDNATISTVGVKNGEFVSKAKVAFSFSGRTPHNESVKVTCDTDNGYYDLLTSQDYYITSCAYGQFKNSSMCVKKCKFRNTEFSKEETIKGRDVSQSSAAQQYEMKAFTAATNPMTGTQVDYVGGFFFVKFGDSVKITCPTTHPPYNSDTRVMSNAKPDSSFITRCLDTSTTEINKWSVEMACYNGFKSCKNSEITVTQENKQCNTFGQCFYVKGGSKMVDDGMTPHGGRLELNCPKRIYNQTNFVTPKCNDGVWSSSEAYCRANECSFSNMKEIANGETKWKVGNVSQEDVTKYYGQNYTFKCAQSNRMWGSDGKTFRCMFDTDDVRSLDTINDGGQWFAKYCVKNGCSSLPNPQLALSHGESYTILSNRDDFWESCWGVCYASVTSFGGHCYRVTTQYKCNNGSMQAIQNDELKVFSPAGAGDSYGTSGSNKGGTVDVLFRDARKFCYLNYLNTIITNATFNDQEDLSGNYDGYYFSDSNWQVKSTINGERIVCNYDSCWEASFTVTR